MTLHHLIVFAVIGLIVVIFALSLSYLRKFSNGLLGEITPVLKFFHESTLKDRGKKSNILFINEAFNGSDTLKSYWQSYSASIVTTDPTLEEPLYLSSDSGEVFNIENLLNDSDFFVSYSIWNAVPQVLTSIGIIGTFASILTSLQGLNSGNIDEVFIKQLVASLALGFWASLAGIFSAVLFTIIEKARTNKVNCLLAKINQFIHQSFPKMTVENILIEQSHTLRNLSVDIQTSISNGFTQVTGGLGAALADVLDDETKTAIKQGVSASFTELTNILTNIRDESRGLHEELEQLKQAKEQMFNNLKSITAEQQKMQSNIDIQNRALVETLQTFDQALASFSNAAAQMDSAGKITNKLADSANLISAASDIMSQSVIQSGQISATHIEQIKKLTSSIKSEYDGLSSDVETWVNQSNEHLTKNLVGFDKSISAVLSQFGSLCNALNAAVIGLERSVTKMPEKVAA